MAAAETLYMYQSKVSIKNNYKRIVDGHNLTMQRQNADIAYLGLDRMKPVKVI